MINAKQKILVFFLLLIIVPLNNIIAEDAVNKLYSALPTGYVNDYADAIDEEWQQKIEQLLQLIDAKSSNQIAVATITSISPYSIEEVAANLFEKWKIGKKGKDNGILILLTLEERKIRAEVGYGLEELFPDSVCGRFIDYYAVPFFKNGEFGKGFYNLVYAFGIDLAKQGGSTFEAWMSDENLTSAASDGDWKKKSTPKSPFAVIGMILLYFIFQIAFRSRFARSRSLLHYGYLGSRSRNNGGFWGGFGGGSSGGFGGFGGGSSGGGGSSRSF